MPRLSCCPKLILFLFVAGFTHKDFPISTRNHSMIEGDVRTPDSSGICDCSFIHTVAPHAVRVETNMQQIDIVISIFLSRRTRGLVSAHGGKLLEKVAVERHIRA